MHVVTLSSSVSWYKCSCYSRTSHVTDVIFYEVHFLKSLPLKFQQVVCQLAHSKVAVKQIIKMISLETEFSLLESSSSSNHEMVVLIIDNFMTKFKYQFLHFRVSCANISCL